MTTLLGVVARYGKPSRFPLRGMISLPDGQGGYAKRNDWLRFSEDSVLEKEPQKILLVDNDEDVLIALERTLENDGYSTTTALNHEEASKLLTHDTFAVLVLDDCLSDRDSIQVLTELRGAGLAPLVIVTYHRFPLPQQQEQLRALRVSALVNKRAHTELAHIVNQLLQPIGRHRVSFEEVRRMGLNFASGHH